MFNQLKDENVNSHQPYLGLPSWEVTFLTILILLDNYNTNFRLIIYIT